MINSAIATVLAVVLQRICPGCGGTLMFDVTSREVGDGLSLDVFCGSCSWSLCRYFQSHFGPGLSLLDTDSQRVAIESELASPPIRASGHHVPQMALESLVKLRRENALYPALRNRVRSLLENHSSVATGPFSVHLRQESEPEIKWPWLKQAVLRGEFNRIAANVAASQTRALKILHHDTEPSLFDWSLVTSTEITQEMLLVLILLRRVHSDESALRNLVVNSLDSGMTVYPGTFRAELSPFSGRLTWRAVRDALGEQRTAELRERAPIYIRRYVDISSGLSQGRNVSLLSNQRNVIPNDVVRVL